MVLRALKTNGERTKVLGLKPDSDAIVTPSVVITVIGSDVARLN
jgi:hypothetical protein